MPPSAPILVTGASGLLGRALMAQFRGRGAVGTARTRVGRGLQRLDLLQPRAVQRLVQDVRPAVIVHAAAERRVEEAERHGARVMALNAGGTRIIAREAERVGAWVLYISTNAVFDGTRPPYAPTDVPSPRTAYGRSKAAGEEMVRASAPGSGVLRLPLLYGFVEQAAESSVSRLAEALWAGRPVQVDDRSVRYPTFVEDVACVCVDLVDECLSGRPPTGTWHWSSDEGLTKYGMAQVIADVLDVGLEPVTADRAGEPRDGRLLTSLPPSVATRPRTPFRDGISAVWRAWRARR